MSVAESTLTADVCARLEMLGFRAWRVHQTRRKPRETVDPGHADITAFGHGVTLFIETKVDRNRQSVQQEEFEKWATRNGSLYWVIRSVDELMLCGRAKGWWR